MSSTSRDRFLVKRGDRYHYRRRIPVDVQSQFGGQTWWKVSLRTTSVGEAANKVRELARKHDVAIEAARDPASLAERYGALSGTVADALATYLPPTTTIERAAGAASKIRAAMLAAAAKRLHALSEPERQAVAKLGGIPAFFTRATSDARQHEADSLTLMFSELNGDLPERDAETLQAVLDTRSKHVAVDQNTLVQLGLSADNGYEEPDNPRINTAMDQWFAERKQGKSAVKRHRISIRRFVELHGNIPVRAITKAMVRDYLKKIENLPDHRRLPTEHRGGLADPDESICRIAAPTVERHLISIKALLKFCIEQDWLVTNVATGLKGPKDTRPKGAGRRTFTRAERNQVLSHAVADCGENGDMTWLVRLAVYTGARLVELGQLARSNVREIDGVWVIEIDDLDGRRVKGDTSVKQIPLHPVIRDDFVSWVQSGKGKHVFPSFQPCDSNDMSGAFGRLMDRAGLPDPRLVFHSFRHTLKREMSNARIDPDVRRAILGHAPRDAHDGYAGHSLEAIAEEFARLPAQFG